MHVEELMIGDLVNVFGVPKRIQGVRKFRNGDEMVYYDGDNGNFIKAVEPIPLTHEVVAQVATPSANGYWKLTPNLYLEGNTLWCTLQPKSDMIILYENDLEFLDFLSKETFYEKICDINYVHEFQHKLKELKIEKEIVI